jgi:mono/diheme cytochrome c family protein
MRKGHVTVFWALMAIASGVPIWTDARGEGESGKRDIARGKTVYVKLCAGCHGPAGKGDGYKLLGPDPANLTAPSTTQNSDAVLLETIHTGRPNMPSWRGRLSDEDSRDVLAYVRTLAK